jgi:hypothetical protein
LPLVKTYMLPIPCTRRSAFTTLVRASCLRVALRHRETDGATESRHGSRTL